MQIKFEFCTLDFTKKYVICTVTEGTTISLNYGLKIIEACLFYYKNKKFVYITHRINSYAVDPQIHFKTSKLTTLAGFAVVATSFSASKIAAYERKFIKKPFYLCETMEQATNWANAIIN